MPAFELRKVVNPHAHMPEEIKKAFFDGTRDWEKGNDSYVDWTVGSWDSDHPDDVLLKVVDTWALENFEKDESIIILHWW